MHLYPCLYRITAASCGALTSIPLDILQTNILNNNKIIKFNLEELKIFFLMITLFSVQNIIYNWSGFLKNKSYRSILSGLSSVPFYIFLETKKINTRLALYPKYNKLIFWIIVRQIIVFVTLYNIIELNIMYSKFIGALLANSFGFPLRILAIKEAYPSLNLNSNNIKKTGLLEIIKSSLSDGITLYLIYNFKHSPFKKI